jgi:hypothetical protein
MKEIRTKSSKMINSWIETGGNLRRDLSTAIGLLSTLVDRID